MSRNKRSPTILPYPHFNPIDDVTALRKAMKGLGTDEKTLIEILCNRTNEQRQRIALDYKTSLGRDLYDDVKSETSGNLQKVLLALLTPPVDYYVNLLHDSMAGLGTDEDVLIEIMCTLTNNEIKIIKNAYQTKHKDTLEKAIMSDTSGYFKRLLVALCNACRDESTSTNLAQAADDAHKLYEAGEGKLGTDEETFNMILCRRSPTQIKLICDEYEALANNSLENAIKKEFSGDIENALLAILQCIQNRAEYFAGLLHKSMKGAGTNNNQLIRIIVNRCEVDLREISYVFEEKYGKSLASWIEGDTSGDYRNALLTLVKN